MKSRFETYRIGRSLLPPDRDFDDLYSSRRPSTPEEIHRAVEPLIPRDCGLKFLRIGGEGDGAYLLPNDLTGIEACFSPGVNNFKNFEDQLAKDFAIKSFMCDYTSDSEKLRTPLIPGMQFFEKKWLDVVPDPRNNDINQWVQRNSASGNDLLLQMDIEGAEYRNILHASMETLARFRIIVLEIHDLGFLGEDGFLNGIFVPVVDKLTTLFTTVHVHPNNCCGVADFGPDVKIPKVLEITFLRKDRTFKSGAPLTLPHALDVINVKANPPLHLEGVWLRNADPIQSSLAALRQSVKWIEGQVKQSNLQSQQVRTELDTCVEQIAHCIAKTQMGAVNIARGGLASQSSMSKDSTREGAGGAINGNKTGRFGFHTDLQPNPWWMVDLAGVFDLSEIVVFNRLDACSDRSKTLKASVSMDGVVWQAVYDHGDRPPFGGIRSLKGRPRLVITLDQTTARFVKLECVGETYLHLDEVEVFGSPRAG